VDALIRIIVCFGTALMLCSLLITGEITLFIHPKLKWLVGMSVGLLVILGVVQLWQIRSGELHRIGWWSYSIALLPVFFFLLVPPKALDASIASKKGVTYLDGSILNKQQEKSTTESDLSYADEIYEDFKQGIEPYKKMPIIEFSDQDYGDAYTMIYSFPNEVEGKKIKLKGFIYFDPEKKYQPVIGRFTVTCCAADATVVGFYMQTDQEFKENQWIEATGTIRVKKEEELETPIIELESFKKIDPPKDPYVYF
jgi:putative membrane protein